MKNRSSSNVIQMCALFVFSWCIFWVFCYFFLMLFWHFLLICAAIVMRDRRKVSLSWKEEYQFTEISRMSWPRSPVQVKESKILFDFPCTCKREIIAQTQAIWASLGKSLTLNCPCCVLFHFVTDLPFALEFFKGILWQSFALFDTTSEQFQ